MSRNTAFLCKLIGLFVMAFVIGVFVNHDFADLLLADRALLLVFAVLAVAAGLALVLCHNVWSGGAATVIVTLVGWLVLLKGIALLIVPDASLTGLFDALHVEDYLDLYLIVPFALGVYLTYSGFKTRLT